LRFSTTFLKEAVSNFLLQPLFILPILNSPYFSGAPYGKQCFIKVLLQAILPRFLVAEGIIFIIFVDHAPDY